MKDFFAVMSKAFAIVFGSTSALALVLVLVVFALRPLLKPQTQVQQAPEPLASPSSRSPIYDGYISDCTKDGCLIRDSGKHVLAYLSHDEITKAQRVPESDVPSSAK